MLLFQIGRRVNTIRDRVVRRGRILPTPSARNASLLCVDFGTNLLTHAVISRLVHDERGIKTMLRNSLLSFVVLIQFAGVSPAQQPAPSPSPNPQRSAQKPPQSEAEDVVRITTNLVQVDAVITEKGKVVTDLKPEEIEIFEDGKRQKITNFSYIVTETPEATGASKAKTVEKNASPVPPTRLKPEHIHRTIAIVVDDLGLSFESTHFVRQALKKFVDDQMQPGDLVAIIRTAGGMGALQQFTSDKRQLYASIERIRWYASGRGGVGAFAPIEPPTPGEHGAEIDAANEELNQFREDLFAVGTLGAVNYVVRGLRELPGRKSILLISDGFRIFSRDDPTRTYRALQKLQRLIDEAGRASVVIYTMNATGLQTLGLTAADSTGDMTPNQLEERLSSRSLAAFETQEGLDYLAKETGGLAIRNTNDLNGGIRRVLEDQKGYYLVGYRPDESTFDPRTGGRKFHHLSLKVRRPGKFNVRMRNGFFGVTDEEARPAPKTAQQQLVSALISPFGSSAVHLQLTSFFANTPSGSVMRSVLHIDARDLTFTNEADGWHKAVVELLAVTFGDNGVAVDQTAKGYAIRLSDRTYNLALRDGFVYTAIVPIKKPGAYQLRVALRDTTSERVGSAAQFVEVPDIRKNRLMLSGIVMNGIDLATFERLSNANAGTRAPNASGPSNTQPGTPGGQAATSASENNGEGAEQVEAQASAAVRHFRPNTVLQYSFAIYNARLDKSSGQPRLTTQVCVFRDGKQIFTGKEIPFEVRGVTDLKRLPAGGAIQLGTDMTPGEYVLQVIVTDLLADEKHHTSTQWMDFEVVK
jgi:VWFA-related protein